MAISHRTSRLKLKGSPSVEQLQNGRYKLTVECTTINSREDWYSANKARIFPDFGSLESAVMSIDGLSPRKGEAYTDMRLTEVKSGNRSPRDGEDYIVVLTYETLGSAFVQVKDDTFNYVENGLRRVTRQSIAKVGTEFQKTIGTTSITSQIDGESGVTCILANYEVNDTDSYREVTEVYIQAGTISETEDKVGSQLSIVKETFASTPSTPSGYSIANEQESNVDGISTKRFTFLKNNVQLSQSEDKVGSQLSISQQWFNPSEDKTVSGYSLASQNTSDFEGIETIEYRFLKENVQLSRSVDNQSPLKTEVREYFKPDSSKATLTNYSLVNKQESNVDGIPTERYTFAKDNVLMSETERLVGSQLAIVQEVFNGVPIAPAGYSIALKETSEAVGLPTQRYTFLKDNAVLSETEDKVGSQLSLVREVFNGTPSTPSGYSIANEQVSNVDGIPTRRFTFLKNNVTLSETEDKVGSQLAIVKEVFNGTPSTPSGYSIASEQESNVDGISTKRFTFLKPSVLSLSISERNGGTGTGKLRIEVVEAFNETPTSTISGVKIGEEVSNVEGIPTRRFTFAKGEGEIRTSTRPGRIAGTTEVTAVSYGTEVTPTGVLIFSSETQENGYIQFTNTCIQGTIEGTKQTYKDVVQVEVPGEVNCTTVAVSSGGISGSIAVPQVTPRRRKTIAAQVTVEVLSTPPDTASVAFDLGAISCSVTSTNVSLSRGPGATVTVGTTAVVSQTGFTQNFGASARIQTYPGCFLATSSSTGTVSYTSSETPRAAGSGIVTDTFNSDRQTKCIGAGSTSTVGYNTTGIIKRNSRPIVTDLAGVTYYEVITWSV